MTTRTLYVPVLIETAEQAEALPEGTVATHPESLPIELHRDADEGVFGYGVGTDLIEPDDLIGWTALVPIEAEEEATTPVQGFAGVFHLPRPAGAFHTPRTRLVTRWEEA